MKPDILSAVTKIRFSVLGRLGWTKGPKRSQLADRLAEAARAGDAALAQRLVDLHTRRVEREFALRADLLVASVKRRTGGPG